MIFAGATKAGEWAGKAVALDVGAKRNVEEDHFVSASMRLLYYLRIDVSSILKICIDQIATIIGRFLPADESDDDPDDARKRRQHHKYDGEPKTKSIDRSLP